MQLIKYSGVALVSAPFVTMGILMAINGTRRRVFSFVAAGLLLVGLMTTSSVMAMNNIAEDGQIKISFDITPKALSTYG